MFCFMTLFLPLILLTIIFSNHPITLILALTFVTTLLAYKTYLLIKLSMLSYIILLVILGGMVILFVYMATLAPNEPFSSKQNGMITFGGLLGTYTMLIIPTNISSEMTSPKINTLMLHPIWVILAMMYLLITLIAVVKITSISQGPLRAFM